MLKRIFILLFIFIFAMLPNFAARVTPERSVHSDGTALRMYEITAASTQVITATGGTTSWWDIGDMTIIAIQVNASAVGGTTPSFTFSVQTTMDETNFASIGSMTAITANGNYIKTDFTVKPMRFIKVTWVVSGTTPTGTFSIWVVAKT